MTPEEGDLLELTVVRRGTIWPIYRRSKCWRPGAEQAVARRGVAGPVDLVLDPPRTGAGTRVVRALAGCGARAIAYVAGDPAIFARDVRTFRSAGWRLAGLQAYDLFPMTQQRRVRRSVDSRARSVTVPPRLVVPAAGGIGADRLSAHER